MNIFFAHPKGMEDSEIDSWTSQVKKIAEDSGYENVTVVPGRDDFKQYAPAAGGFAGWIRDVATRTNAMTHKPYFDLFVSPYRAVGKATADILTLALHNKRPVVLTEKLECGSVELHRVTQVVVDDPDNYTDGWWLDT